MAKHSSKFQAPLGWHHRNYLPHFDGGERRWQFITLHLGDALPKNALDRMKIELAYLESKSEEFKLELRRKIEKYLDAGYGECYIKQEIIAAQVCSSLFHFHEQRYTIKSWVIMPNHIHFLFKPIEGFTLSSLIHSIKSYTASEANKILNKKGQFWQEDYFDRYIRDRDHFNKTIRYIENNPVKAGLCEKPQDWKFSSAYKNGE